MEDKKGMTPTHWAKKQNTTEILNLLLENGGMAVTERRKPNSMKPLKEVSVTPEQKNRDNERKIPRRYMLTALREGGYYSPMTDAEFEDFKRQNPQLARYFEVNEEGEDVCPVKELIVPEVPESAPIFDQWEKAAQRMLTTLQKDQKAYIFANPVDYIALKILDYPSIVKNPMDFHTIKTKLKDQKYQGIGDFMEDMELVFYNCKLYNGTTTEIGQIGVSVQQEYQKLAEQLYFDFYKR